MIEEITGFQELSLRSEYRSQRKDLVRGFLVPLLSKSVSYDRAVGFFSSTALSLVSVGISGLVRNDGRVRVISSPKLSAIDFDAMKKGYDLRQVIIDNSRRNLEAPTDHFQVERLNLLASLIAEDILDFRIAFSKPGNEIGIFHEKMAIATDFCGDVVSFSGSLNDSEQAFLHNYEAIDVFRSWISQEEKLRIQSKSEAFERIWENRESSLVTMKIPEIKDEIINKYLRTKPNYNIDIEEFGVPSETSNLTETTEIGIPENVILYDYQLEAIENWKSNDYRGIFDMATGTGKTFTAIGGLIDLYKMKDGDLGVIIVCPFQHLVEQWAEELKRFNIAPILGYSSSPQKDWKRRLRSAIVDRKLGLSDASFFCFVCTNATYSSLRVQRMISSIEEDMLLIADEAHNLGAENLRKLLPENFKYRLALSATLERKFDPEGTEKLLDFFGKKSIEYTLERAISEKKLTPYRYYPIVVTLVESELSEYKAYSDLIKKELREDISKRTYLSEKGKRLAIMRSRIVSGALRKIDSLMEEISKYADDTHMLVYCGATNVLDPTKDESNTDQDDIRQIDMVTEMLEGKFGIKLSQFTAKEDVVERKKLIYEFSKGETLQALIAIKCLDEGVDIPSIKTAFILASTTNPKEYIQRRGRVLRLYQGKMRAEIYDFITLPFAVEELWKYTPQEIDNYSTLVRNEIARGYEFSTIAENAVEATRTINEIADAYGVNPEGIDYQLNG